MPTTNLVQRHLLPCLGPRRLYALTPEVLDEFLRESCAPAGPMARRRFPQRPWRTFAPSFYEIFALCAAPSISLRRTEPHVLSKNRQSATRIMTREEQGKAGNGVIPMPDPLHLGILTAPVWGTTNWGGVRPCNGDISLESGTIRIHKTMIRIQDLTPDARRRPRSSLTAPKQRVPTGSSPCPPF